MVVDSVGLFFRFQAKNTTVGNELLEAIKSGDLTNTSFAFIVAPNGAKFTKRSDGTFLREITKFQSIADVSIVNIPAYESVRPTVQARKQLNNPLDVYYMEYDEIIHTLKNI